METDYQKLLNACKEYRAKLDEALEANNELHQRFITIPDEVWSKADLVKQIHQAYAERDELQKENTKLKDALKEEKIHRSLDGWNEAAIINELKRENAGLNETTRKHVAAYYELMAENAELRTALTFIRADIDEELGISQAALIERIGDYCDRALKGKEAQP